MNLSRSKFVCTNILKFEERLRNCGFAVNKAIGNVNIISFSLSTSTLILLHIEHAILGMMIRK